MKLVTFIVVMLVLIALDVLIAISGSLYAGRSAAILIVLFFGIMAVAVWKRWDGALFALHTLAIVGLLLRGVVVTEGAVLPSLIRSLILLAVVNGLVYATIKLRPPT